MSDNEPKAPETQIASIPTVLEWQKSYGRSCEGNDQKAVRIFRDYESKEKVRRLQNELQLIKDDKVRENVLEEVVGKKRMQKYQSYSGWAKLMLLWIVAK